MHINMKYYVVSIGAIFIALGIGMLVGFNLNYDQELSKQQATIIEDLDKKSVSVEYDKIFLGGGTSERFKKFLVKGFKDNGAKSVKVIDNAIFANAIGAYKKAKVDIAKLEKENK